MNSSNHLHKYEESGQYLVCDCGKKILNFKKNNGKFIATRSDGKTYTKKENKDRFLFPDEWIALIKHLHPRQLHTATFLLNTGVRIQEGQKAPCEDLFYLPKGRSRLKVRYVKTKARKGEFKFGKQREIPISSDFAKYLVKYAKSHKTETFNLLSCSAINKAVKKAAQKAGIRDPHDLSAHTFRKTLEVWLMALGVMDLKLVAHLGHDMHTAASHYVSPDVLGIDDKIKIRHILGDLYK
jgi:integrase